MGCWAAAQQQAQQQQAQQQQRQQQLHHMARRARVAWWWLAVALAIVAPGVLCQASAQATSSETFFAALTNHSITRIEIPADSFQLLPQDWARFTDANPYVLRRNVTLTSSSPDALGQMDFQWLAHKVLLAPRVTLVLHRLALRNVRRLGGFGLDFFVGDTGSSIVLDSVIRIKLVCLPPDQALAVAREFADAAPPGAPPNLVTLRAAPTCVPRNANRVGGGGGGAQPQCFDGGALHFEQFTLRMSSVDPELGVSRAGYLLHMHNTTRVCENLLSTDCIARLGEDTCTAQLLQQLLSPPPPPAPPPGELSGAAIAGIAASGGVVLLLALLGVLLCRRRKGAWLARLRNGKSSSEDDGDAQPASTSAAPDAEPHQLPLLPLLPAAGSASSSSGGQSAMAFVRLGVLLGSGSFGRVYRARWHGSDVAVKILNPCRAADLPKVLREAEIMMQLNHPNVVKAFQCSVFNPAEHQQSAKLRDSDAAAQPTGPQQQQPRQPSLPQRGDHAVAGATALPAAAAPAAAAASRDSVVVSLVPEIVQRHRSGGSSGGGGGGGAGDVQQQLDSGAPAAVAGPCVSSSASGVSSGPRTGMQQMLSSLFQHQQRQAQLLRPLQLGPPTGSQGSEPLPRAGLVATPSSTALSSSSALAGAITSAGSSGLAGLEEAASPGASAPWLASGWAAAGTRGSSSSATATDTRTSTGAISGEGQATAAESADRAAGAFTGWLLPPQRPRSASGTSGAATSSSGGDGSSSRLAGAHADVQTLVPAPEVRETGSSIVDEARRQQPKDVQVWLVLELCSGGSLKHAVSTGRVSARNAAEMSNMLSLLLDAARGMAYLHDRGCLHGDLKAANVLLHNTPHGQVAKVSDFGVAALLADDGATHRSTTSLGTITHASPQLLRSGKLDRAADVYSWGMLMWETYTGRTPFAGLHSGAIVERVVLRGERPPVPDSMRQVPQFALLMERCWDEDPARRPSFGQIVSCLELLRDNLTSSDSESRISEGVEERTSSSSSAGSGAARLAGQAADAAAASDAGPRARASAPAAAPKHGAGASTVPGGGAAAALSPGAAPQCASPPPAGKGLGEGVEEEPGLSGPDTPLPHLLPHIAGRRSGRDWHW